MVKLGKINESVSCKLVIYAKSLKTGDEYEIKDLYWFEENGVSEWDGIGHHERFEFRVELIMKEDNMEEKSERLGCYQLTTNEQLIQGVNKVVGVVCTNASEEIIKEIAKTCKPDSRLYTNAVICMLKARGYEANSGFVREINVDME